MSYIELRKNKAPKLGRRSFLAGAGVCMSLPLLEAMLPTGKTAFAQDANPGRMLVFFTGNGCDMQTFQLNGSTTFNGGFGTATSLNPLRDIIGDITTIKGLHNDPMSGQAGDHGKGSGAFMTCRAVTKNRISSHTTMDVLAANQIGNQTRISNLAIGTSPSQGTGEPDNGFNWAYMDNISWLNSTTPVPKETDPQRLFNRLFSDGVPTGGGGGGGANAGAIANESVIDAVLADVTRLQRRLGAADRAKLEGYLSGIRDIEARLGDSSESEPPPSSCDVPDITGRGNSGDWLRNGPIFNDIMTMAFACDLTRIISYVYSPGLNGRVYNNIGIREGHHAISHHGNNAGKQDQLRQIDVFHMEQFADLCKKLKAEVDVQGKSILESTIAMYSNEIADGNSHSHYNLPVVLAGQGNGAVKSGRHINFGNNQMSNLYLTMMRAVGMNVDSYANSSGGLNLSS